MTTNAAHLSEAQVTELVMDEMPTAACQAHLAACADCRECLEVERVLFAESMRDFNAATLAWSAAQPRPVTVERRQAFAFRFAPAVLAVGMVAVAVATVPGWREPVVAPQDSAAQIAADDALLQSVDQVLAANDLAPQDPYELLDGAEPGTR